MSKERTQILGKNKARIQAQIKNEEALTELLRKYNKKGSVVGYGDIDPEPLVSQTYQINGESVPVEVGNIYKSVSPRVSALVLEDNSVVFVSGVPGQPLSEEDVRKILNRSQKNQLTRALKKNLESRKKKFGNSVK
ncbi:MAG: hypothetical protein QY322_01155 [bacterium]|nr:MAG: hypothetical protein QY322_01155 [bacterium]